MFVCTFVRFPGDKTFCTLSEKSVLCVWVWSVYSTLEYP